MTFVVLISTYKMKRPLSVTLISYLFIIAGTAGILYHAAELIEIVAEPDVILVLVVRMLAIVGGVFALRGARWSRWLLTAWIGYHVVLSFYHSTSELAMHAALMIVVLVALFHPKANRYFKGL
jgi:hypothetical protein